MIARLAGTMVDPGIALHRHRGLGEGRDEVAHRLGDADLAFFHQRQDGGAGDGLGLRRDAEDRVRGHLAAGFLVAPADGALVYRLAILQHQCDHARHLAIVHVLLQNLIQPLQPLRRNRRGPLGSKQRSNPKQ